MDAREEIEICRNCIKEVAKSNLPMHEAHCKRFLCLCPDCEEQVPKDQLEEHRQEAHAPIKCKKCNMEMERCKLPDHEANDCTERLQNCEFCQLALPSSNLKEHVVTCGSRTERCQDCNQYVMLKDQLQHAQFCTTDDFKPKSTDRNVKPLPANTLQEDELDDYAADDSRDQSGKLSANSEPQDMTLSLSDLQKKKKQNEKMGYIDQDQINTCPYCHLALPVKTLQWHEDKCRIFEGLRRMREVMAGTSEK